MPSLPDIPGVCWILAIVAVIALTAVSVTTHHLSWKKRLPLRLAAFVVCASLVWMAADLALRQEVASIDQLVQVGHSRHLKSMTINAGSVRAGDQLIRPEITMRIPGGATLPWIRLQAGTFAPVGTAAIAARVRAGKCQIADTTVTCSQAQGTLHIDY